MLDLLGAYTNASRPADIAAVLSAIVNALPFTVDGPTRTTLIHAILNDLKSSFLTSQSSSSSKFTKKDAPLALLAVKSLGRNPTGSECLAEPDVLSILLSLAQTFSAAANKDRDGKDMENASNEALRCTANALLLHPPARSAILRKDVNGGQIIISMLDNATTPDQIFVMSRILFLSTVSPSTFIISLVEDSLSSSSSSLVSLSKKESKRKGSSPSSSDSDKDKEKRLFSLRRNGSDKRDTEDGPRTAISVISTKMDTCMLAILQGAKMSKEAMTDLLKFTFNLLMHYPKMVDCEPQGPNAGEDGQKIIGDYWSPRLDGLLNPLLRAFHSLPPTFPTPLAAPLTHVIHSLIVIPVNDGLKPVWFIPVSGSIFSSPPSSPQGSSPVLAASHTLPSSYNCARNSPVVTASLKPSKTLDRALSVLTAASRRSLSLPRTGNSSRSPSPIPPSGPFTSSNSVANSIPHSPTDDESGDQLLFRIQSLLDVCFSHYFPAAVDPDDPSVRERVSQEFPSPTSTPGSRSSSDSNLDDLLSPLIVLLTRLAVGSPTLRVKAREWIIPPDLDRSSALEERSDMLGKCLRLLACVHYPRIKDAVGELLYALCDSDASMLSTLVGYGNVAGFLFNKGILSAPPSMTATTSTSLTAGNGMPINPITGRTSNPKEDGKGVEEEMTEEEKEREAEKLFVLFDRLEKTGAIPPSQNPMRRALQEGGKG